MDQSFTFDAVGIAGLVGLIMVSAVQVGFGIAVGRYIWRREPEKNHSKRQADQAAQALSQVHNMTGALRAQAGRYAEEIEAIQKQLSPDNPIDDEQRHAALVNALEKISQVNSDLQAQLHSAESRLEQQTRQLESQMAAARTDALTGLANRRAFDDEMNRRVTVYQQKADPTSLMLIDVDHFKKFNDTYGHQAGDEVLRGVARVLFANVRDQDVVCRYGGEEFAVILPGDQATEAQKTAERVRAAIQATTFPIDGRDLKVTISGGLTQVTATDTPEAMLKRADEALYASKAAGRNCAHLHTGQRCESITPPAARKDVVPNKLAAQAQLEYRDKQQQVVEADDDSRTDGLTGLPNQRAFSEDLRRRIAQWRRFNTPLSIVLADVDGLNELNERYGRETGDIVLRAVTQFLTAAVREMDVVSRYHGDEFVLMLPGTTLDNAIRAAERIRNAISMCKLRLNVGELTFTVSTGVAEASCDDDAVSLVARANTALDTSKSYGFNCTHVHNGNGCLLIESSVAPVQAATV